MGTDHDTAAFAVESIRRWWNARGRADYPQPAGCWSPPTPAGPTATAPAPGRRSWPPWRWKPGWQVTVCHFPPGTSKWNKIEHRLFSRITMNWRGRPLASHQVIVESIAATATRTGLTVHAELDPGSYPAGREDQRAPRWTPCR